MVTLYLVGVLVTVVTLYPVFPAADGSGESGNESSCEDEVIPIKHKPVQVRHSLLDKLDESSAKVTSEPPLKRQKREDNMVSHQNKINHRVM